MGDWEGERRMYLRSVCHLVLNIKLTWSCQKEKAGESIHISGGKRKSCAWSTLIFILRKETKFTFPQKSTSHWMPWMDLAWGANTLPWLLSLLHIPLALQFIIWHNILEGLQRSCHVQWCQWSVHNASVLCMMDPNHWRKESTVGTLKDWIINILYLWDRDVTHLYSY